MFLIEKEEYRNFSENPVHKAVRKGVSSEV